MKRSKSENDIKNMVHHNIDTYRSISENISEINGILNEQNVPCSKYLRATLQSSGYLPYDDTFMNDYLRDVYEHERCRFTGCFVNNHCIECLNKNTCTKLSGTYCE